MFQHAKRKKEIGRKINPRQARLGKKMEQLVVYTSLTWTQNIFVPKSFGTQFFLTKNCFGPKKEFGPNMFGSKLFDP